MAEDTKTEMVLTVQYHAGNPKMARIPELNIRQLPEWEGGGWYMPSGQAEALVTLAARPSADQAEGVGEPVAWQKREKDESEWSPCYGSPGFRAAYSDKYEFRPLYAPGADPAIARLTEELERVSGLCTEHFNRAQSNIKEVARLNDLAESRRVEVAQAIDLERSRTEHAIGQQLLMERRAFAAEAALAERDANIAKALEALDESPEYHDQGMGCGLEDRNITDRYEAMAHGWEQAMERVYGENIAWALAALRASSATQADGSAIQPVKEAGR